RGPPRVLRHDGVADGSEGRRIERGARGVDGGIEHQESRAWEGRCQHGRGREEGGVTAALDRNRRGSGQLAVVVVVPGRYREHDSIASIDRKLVRGEQ